MEGQFKVSLNHGVIRLLLLLCLIGGSGWLTWHGQRPSADVAGADATLGDSFFSNRTINISVAGNGQITIGEKTVADTVMRQAQSDELRVEILNGRKIPVQGGTQIIIHLDSAVRLPETASMRAIGIHGAELASETPVRLSDNTAEWTLINLDPEGAVSTIVSYPPGSFVLGSRAWLRSLPSLFGWIGWLGAGLAVALIFILYLWQLHRVWRTPGQTGLLDAPPSALSPGATGALLSGRAGPPQLAATLVAMAARGDIQIVQSVAGYRVARRRATPTLSSTEQILLDELRLGLGPITSQEHVEHALGEQLFNKKIAEAYGGLLDELRIRGFFNSDSQVARAWHRFTALLCILIAVIGATLAITRLPDGVLTIGFWLGWLTAGWLLFVWMPNLPRLNSVGQAERQRWLSFRRYLVDPRPIGGGQAEARLFLLYLPYAISFDVVPAWLGRFNRDLLTIPDWYFNTDNPAASSVFVEDILAISTEIARDFTKVALSD